MDFARNPINSLHLKEQEFGPIFSVITISALFLSIVFSVSLPSRYKAHFTL